MKNLVVFLISAAFVGGVCAEEIIDKAQAKEISIKLPQDSEYNGALIDSRVDAVLYDTGHLRSARLKEDYVANGVVFIKDKEIAFYQDGNVWKGTLKNESTIQGVSYLEGSRIEFYPSGNVSRGTAKAGSNPGGLNLILPVDMELHFDRNTHVYSVSSDAVQSYKLLGMPCTRETRLIYDDSSNKYKLFSGVVSKPIFIASLPLSVDNMGRPTSAEPVVAPSLSSFQLYIGNPERAAGQQSFDSWKTTKSIVINNYDFDGPHFLVRDMRLVGVQVFKTTVLDGYEFKPWDVVTFNNVGKVNPPNQ